MIFLSLICSYLTSCHNISYCSYTPIVQLSPTSGYKKILLKCARILLKSTLARHVDLQAFRKMTKSFAYIVIIQLVNNAYLSLCKGISEYWTK